MDLHPDVLKILFSIIWKCIFLNYSSQGIEAPRSFKFFISAQLQTGDLVKGTQFWGVGIAAGRSWQDFQSRGTSCFFITAKWRNKSRSIKIRKKRKTRVAGWEESHRRDPPQEGTRSSDRSLQNFWEQNLKASSRRSWSRPGSHTDSHKAFDVYRSFPKGEYHISCHNKQKKKWCKNMFHVAICMHS